MATRAQEDDAGRMTSITPTRPDIVASAHRLELAATELLELAGIPEMLEELPATLDHLQTALDRLATSLMRMSQAVAERSSRAGAGTDDSALSPAARALQWHLHEAAARVGASSNACPGARHWAGELLADPAALHDPEVTDRMECRPASPTSSSGFHRTASVERLSK